MSLSSELREKLRSLLSGEKRFRLVTLDDWDARLAQVRGTAGFKKAFLPGTVSYLPLAENEK